MDVYKIFTNIGNYITRGSLLSDTVITKIPIILCFADTRRLYTVGWLSADSGTKCAENRERSLYIVAQGTIKLNATGKRRIHVLYLNLI